MVCSGSRETGKKRDICRPRGMINRQDDQPGSDFPVSAKLMPNMSREPGAPAGSAREVQSRLSSTLSARLVIAGDASIEGLSGPKGSAGFRVTFPQFCELGLFRGKVPRV